MIYTVTTNPNIDYYMDLRAPLRVGGINRSGHELLLESLMADTGCSCHWFWLQSGQTRINTKINTSPETAFNASGPALAQDDIDALCAFLRGLTPDDQLVISGNLQKSPQGAFSALLSAAREAGVSAVVDTSGAALREALAFRPLLIKPNGEELCELFGEQRSLRLRSGRRLWARGTFWCPWARTARCCWRKLGAFTGHGSAARSRSSPPSVRATA